MTRVPVGYDRQRERLRLLHLTGKMVDQLKALLRSVAERLRASSSKVTKVSTRRKSTR